MTSHHKCSAGSGEEAQTFFSRRLNSFSTATRMNSAAGSLSSRTAWMRALVPSGNLAGICSKLTWGLLMPAFIDDITYCYKPQNR